MHNLAQSPVLRDMADRPGAAAPLPTEIILEAIARQICVAAVYNRSAVTLAPHILYTKHDALFVDAITVERDGKPPKELKLGAFKLVGLGEIGRTNRRFSTSALFDPSDSKYTGATLFAVQD